MTARFRKKNRRMRGSHTHGYGSKKKHRGGGSRGGRGKAGLMKHKKSWMLKYDPEHFGRKGFKIPPSVKREIKAINLKDIDRLAKKLGQKEIDITKLGYQKVLSTGTLTKPLTIAALSFSKAAKEKIKAVGGQAITK